MRTTPLIVAQDATSSAGADKSSRPSKTQRKQAMTALQQLGEGLLRLNQAQLDRLDLPEALRQALVDAGRITAHEGRRRQLQYVGRLMRQVEPEPLRRALADATGASRAAVALMHQCERWRDRLLDDDQALTDFLAEHPQANVQQLRATIRAARRERAAAAAPRHARDLYRSLHEIVGATPSVA